MNSTTLEEKFIAFVDILGFKKLVEESEAERGFSSSQITELLQEFGAEDVKAKKWRGGRLCPGSPFLSEDLAFNITQVSDCAIISSELSPAGLINLINHCWGIVISFLFKGILCRGYITRGPITHTETNLFGTGYNKAYEAEKNVAVFKTTMEENGTPFVEISEEVVSYAESCDDPCFQKFFKRLRKSDGVNTALYPFKMLAHSIMIAGLGIPFNPDKEKQANDDVRKMILEVKSQVLSYLDSTNPSAVRKVEHYVRALDTQLEHCDRTDAMIEKLRSGFLQGD